MKLLILTPTVGNLRHTYIEEKIAFERKGWIVNLAQIVSVNEAVRLIGAFKPHIVFNSALVLGPSAILQLMSLAPQTYFFTINHSSVSQVLFQASNLRYPCPVFCVNGAEVWSKVYSDTLFLNYVRPLHSVRLNNMPAPKIPIVGIFLRDTVLKNVLNQVVAARISSCVEIWMLESIRSKRLYETAAQPKEIRFQGPADRSEFIRVLSKVSANLQVTLTESLNLTALESLSLGVPCIGSNVIRFLPSRWQVSPEFPSRIAEKIDEILGNLLLEKERAVRIARAVKESFNRHYDLLIDSLERLCDAKNQRGMEAEGYKSSGLLDWDSLLSRIKNEGDWC